MSGRPLDPKAVRKLVRAEAESVRLKEAAEVAARVGSVVVTFDWPLRRPIPGEPKESDYVKMFDDSRYEFRSTPGGDTFLAVVVDERFEYVWPANMIVQVLFVPGGFGGAEDEEDEDQGAENREE